MAVIVTAAGRGQRSRHRAGDEPRKGDSNDEVTHTDEILAPMPSGLAQRANDIG